MDDTYKTVIRPAEGYITEKKSKFISHIFPVKSVEEVKEILDEQHKKYYDARHVCWAYMLGWERIDFRSNDDGEPSGTAGRPILGQINSAELTDVLITVVRYFGGTLLGTGGLIKAYKEAAADAVANAEIVERTVDDTINIAFDYTLLNEVMRVLKQFDTVRWTQDFTDSCRMRLEIRRTLSPQLTNMLTSIHGVTLY
ncbi:putative translation regulator, IMPACT [Proteiniphilum saccharofermentans]|uniref:Putative translation regulator, IMPACT n=1 Tax=Proteiniphilum saccharofermentans TaxID=1642647 RepID=A0A1R3SYA3_9BACT|nr:MULTISPECIES: YigZ family protein [Proteiniphilum]MDY9917693.1 YigZ family protein [Proteiniphilum sp.]SCD21166.1 putative translation regulator, IMPACT [Proteiniphilum saccharofermentans]